MRPVYQTVTDENVGAWIPVDYIQTPFNVGLGAEVLSGTPTYGVDVTFDDVFDPTVTPTAIVSTELAGKTNDAYAALTVPVRAVRLNVTGTGTVKLTVLQGLGG